jgi:hypothetical protein
MSGRKVAAEEPIIDGLRYFENADRPPRLALYMFSYVRAVDGNGVGVPIESCDHAAGQPVRQRPRMLPDPDPEDERRP